MAWYKIIKWIISHFSVCDNLFLFSLQKLDLLRVFAMLRMRIRLKTLTKVIMIIECFIFFPYFETNIAELHRDLQSV